ncbi:hypothetical protein Poli38472_008285 [Pythium oligandrum]|uniref:Acyltransferase n=1 Tax=Pythium oligandrum TaxID=41045 RepID=A0A8K1CMI7_PYTOL|nr:hypothetical protein Poli38472_008285 [Pythium oligandrum]|eukprot:TMW65643.1 hypothetical protein Poli38472_008285 [Pythium oligandrum]
MSSSVEKVSFPNVHARPEQQSFKARFYQECLILSINFTWVLGLAFFVNMYTFSAVSIGRALLSGDPEAVPMSVRCYLGALVLYYSYHYVAHRPEQAPWPEFHQSGRELQAKHPYFRHQICIFDEFEDESLQDHAKAFVKPDDQSLFAFHPHGMLTCGWAVNGVFSKRFKEANARWLVAENLFWFPILRDILRWTSFDTVEKKTFVKYMRQGRNVCFLPGGFEEATVCERGKYRVHVKSKFGFIKLALQHGYKVHPVFSFGEEETYHTFPYFLKQRLMLNRLRVPAAIFIGRLWLFFMPRHDLDMTTVVGKAIQLPKIENPTKEEVAKYHALYVDALVDLFERNKKKYANSPDAKLEVY